MRTAPAASATATGSQTPSGPSIIGSPSVSTDPGNVVIVDPALLSYIPISGNGLQQSVDPDNAAQTAANPALRASASALFIATYTVAVAQGSPPPNDDIAVVSVVRLRDPSFDDNWFRDWRDSYDVAACEPAGGVSGNSQAEIGTHIVFIGSCSGGAFTYHTRVANGVIVISITAVGPARLGETVMSRLAP